MGLSLWGQIGALIGAMLGYLNFRVIIGILEPRLRALDKSVNVDEREAFERKMVLLRRIFFTLEIVILGAIGYVVGSMFGG
jgi:predicted DNA-binding transcriptional regulator